MGEKKRRLDAVKRYSPTARFIYELVDQRNDNRMTMPNLCLGCGAPLDRNTSIGHRQKPSEGTFSICASCGHVQAFDHDLKFRPLTDEEIVRIAGDLDIVTANTVRGPLRDFWKRDDPKGAFEFVRERIRDDVRKARSR